MTSNPVRHRSRAMEIDVPLKKTVSMPVCARRTIGLADAVLTYGISRDKFYDFMADGRITSYRLDGQRLIDVASIEALLKRLAPSAAAATSATLAAARAARAYKALAQQRHPDKPGGSTEAMAELNQALQEAKSEARG